MGCPSCLKKFWKSQTLWLAVLVPIVAAPLPIIVPTPIGKCGYCVIVIGVYWVTEIIPLAVTSLMPVFMFPLFGLMTSKDVCMTYVKDTLMLFLGSLVVAVAVEKWNLHKRLALRTLTLVGPEPKWLLLGVIMPTWFLSMWMSNTATTAMMMPILSAILLQIKQSQSDETEDESMLTSGQEEDVKFENGPGLTKVIAKMDLESGQRRSHKRTMNEKHFLALAKTFALSIAYSANIGGTATLTGTPPNVIFKGMADKLYNQFGASNPVNFANWMVLGVPLSLILVFYLWVSMQIYGEGMRCLMFWKKDTRSYEKVRDALKREYEGLGSMSFAEVLVTINFVLLAILWITRSPGFVPGWGDLFLPGYIGDSTPAILISVLLFILPARVPAWCVCLRSKSAAVSEVLEPVPIYEPLLDWATVNKKMAWGVLLLMGGGFAMADACEVSGLSQWVSQHLEGLHSLPSWVTALLLSVIIATVTEFTSNSATTTLFVPIAGDLAVKLGVHPLYFMLPCTIAASLAFLLPVATPPNAIVFSSGYLKVKDMVLAGLPMNIFAIFMLNIALGTWGAAVYDLFNVPVEFLRNSGNFTNSTLLAGNSASLPAYNVTGGL